MSDPRGSETADGASELVSEAQSIVGDAIALFRRAHPESFGGAWFVNEADSSPGQAVVAVVGSPGAAGEQLRNYPVRFVTVKYSYKRLLEIYAELTAIMRSRGLQSFYGLEMGIDSKRNAVVIGYREKSHAGAASNLVRLAVDAGVPSGAIRSEERPPGRYIPVAR